MDVIRVFSLWKLTTIASVGNIFRPIEIKVDISNLTIYVGNMIQSNEIYGAFPPTIIN